MNRYKLERPLKVVHINTLLPLLHIFVVIDNLIAIHFLKKIHSQKCCSSKNYKSEILSAQGAIDSLLPN